ncbi:MAG: hypothetical protein K0R54_3068 [Clostridiaceae bacterium]|nr:hypothetical protein [Clostridiaceae bacterium]
MFLLNLTVVLAVFEPQPASVAATMDAKSTTDITFFIKTPPNNTFFIILRLNPKYIMVYS